MLKISEITIEKLQSGTLEKELPEFFELKTCIENNKWHHNKSVFNHTLKTLHELQKILEIMNHQITDYLNQQIDSYTRKELLYLATLFHDIGKPETIISNNDVTSCHQHEKIGSQKLKKILEKFDLSEKEKSIVIDLVKYHGEIHVILNQKGKQFKKQFNKFKFAHKNIFWELILLGTADTFGGQLKNSDLKEYSYRINFYKTILNEINSSYLSRRKRS